MKRALSFFMAVIMVISLAPLSIAAEYKPTAFTIVDKKTSTIAPGVTQDIIYANEIAKGQQLVYYLATIDLGHRDANGEQDVHIYSSYKNAQCEDWGMSMLTDQIKAAQSLHSNSNDPENYIPYYTVVGGINASFYNMSNGKPTGAFAMGGKIINEATGSFFAIRQDGSAVIGYAASDWARYNTADNPIVEAVGGARVQIRDGVLVNGLSSSDYNARTSIGLTVDGKVVMAVADGKQAPFSVGADVKHMGEILLEAGCVSAIELDGGGSTTYAARPEGGNAIQLINKPCDGEERAISSGLIIVSTTPPSDTFARAALTAENSYITPGSTVKIDAVGVSPAGTSAEIPANAVWRLVNAALGTVSNGVFVSNGAAGDAVVQMTVDGTVVGETTIHVVAPDSLKFSQSTISVPYGKSADITVTAYYGDHAIATKAGDITLSLSSAALGTLSGFTFSACALSNDAPTSGSITATFTGGSPVATASLALGRSSEVLFDFESYADTAALKQDFDWGQVKHHGQYNNQGKVELVTAATGKVHNGNQALAYTADFSYSKDFSGMQTLMLMYAGTEEIDITGAVGVGAWVWIPNEVTSMQLRLITPNIKNGKQDRDTNTNFDYATEPKYDDGQWFYLYQKLDTSVDKTFYSQTSGQALIEFCNYGTQNATYKALASQKNKFVFYIDDITLDYSSVVDDREMPVFSNVTLRMGGDATVPMNRGQITPCGSGTLAVSAVVADDTTKSNYTGIDPSSAEAYVDGVKVNASYQGGSVFMSEVTLAEGVHTIKLGIADNAGNYTSVIRQLSVSANTDVPTVKVVAHDTTADKIPIGSVYYVDIVATDVSAIDAASVELDLNNISVWELEHADVNYQFTMTYAVDPDENVATLTFTRKDPERTSGKAVLASLPIRTWGTKYPLSWSWNVNSMFPTTDNQTNYSHSETAAWPDVWRTDVSVNTIGGSITYADGRVSNVLPVFGSARIRVDTELYMAGDSLKLVDTSKTRWHTHTPGTAESKEPTCTASGYTDRVFCTSCHSPITWGKAVDAKPHYWTTLYGNPAGALHCMYCAKLYNGDFTGADSVTRTYKDGFTVNGWVGENCYKDGVKLTGMQNVAGPAPESTGTLWYNFGDDGVCAGRQPYTGIFEFGKNSYYAIKGVVQTGWFNIGEDHRHADKDGVLHEVTATDNRTCITSGTIEYTCQTCGATDVSEEQWFNGHTWDANHVCTVCGTQGLDIANGKLTTTGQYFTYTGNEIRAEHTVTYDNYPNKDNPRPLYVGSDRKNGLEGLSEYSNNTDIGTATIKVSGRTNFYGELMGSFKIVPASVTTLTAKQTENGELTISWPEALEAEYYALYYKPAGETWKDHNVDPSQLAADHIEGTSYTFHDLAPGVYTFHAASRAERNGEVYKCVNWSEDLTVTVSLPAAITVASVKNGSAVTDPTGTALPGQTVTVTATPNAGYHVSGVTVRTADNKTVSVSPAEDGRYTFVMPAGPVTVTPAFNAQGECAYLHETGPFRGQLQLTGLLPGRRYVCQMQKANAAGQEIGCAAITVFKAGSETQLLDVLGCPTGYLVSLFAYPDTGEISGIGDLSIAFYGRYVPAGGVMTAAAAVTQNEFISDQPADGEDVSPDGTADGEAIVPGGDVTGENSSGAGDAAAFGEDSPGNDPTDGGSEGSGPNDEGTTSPAAPGPHGDCAYLAQTGPFNAKLQLTGLIDGRTYVCQMQKANASGIDIGCAAIVIFTASGSTQQLDVLPSPNGYLVSLFAYPDSGTVVNIDNLSVAFIAKHAR